MFLLFLSCKTTCKVTCTSTFCLAPSGSSFSHYHFLFIFFNTDTILDKPVSRENKIQWGSYWADIKQGYIGKVGI